VAALRRATAAASALLVAGLAVDVKSRRGWTALEEALAARDHATAKVQLAQRQGSGLCSFQVAGEFWERSKQTSSSH
jgi:hypothetical protein